MPRQPQTPDTTSADRTAGSTPTDLNAAYAALDESDRRQVDRFIALIDPDEAAKPNWLPRLEAAMEALSLPVAGGVVVAWWGHQQAMAK